MRLFGAAAVLLVFFSAQAAEKKTADPRAFRLPKKDAPAKKAEEKPAEPAPAPPKPAPAAKRAEPTVPPTAFELPNRKSDETKTVTPATHESHRSHPSHKSHPTPEVTPAPTPEPAAPPAPTAAPAKTVSTPKPSPRFTLPGQKPAPVKKRNPASFRLPEKKD